MVSSIIYVRMHTEIALHVRGTLSNLTTLRNGSEYDIRAYVALCHICFDADVTHSNERIHPNSILDLLARRSCIW